MTRHPHYEPKPLFEERMIKLLGEQEYKEKFMKIIRTSPPKYIRCNTLKISPAELKKRLEEKNWIIDQPYKDYPEIMIVEGKKFSDSHNKIEDKINASVINSPSVGAGERLHETSSGGWAGNKIIASANASRGGIGSEQLSPGELGKSIEHLLGYYYVQEMSSMLSIIALKPKPNEFMFDLCAAPGSKTTQAAAEMKNTGTIIANDKAIDRLTILASNLERCGVSNTILTKKDGVQLCNGLKGKNWEKKFDKILVDAPCSGEGTLRTSPKTFLMWNLDAIKSMSRVQKKLVASALPLLKKGGEFLYSTCTHTPEEDEEVVDFILKNFPVEIEKVELPIKSRPGITEWNEKVFDERVKFAHRIYPQDNNTEGFFLAKFKLLEEIK